MLPLLQGQAPCKLVAFGAVKFWRSPAPTLQTFLDALIEPSLQTNFPLAQWDTPPFLPLQGVLPACAATDSSASEKRINSLLAVRCLVPSPGRAS